MGLSHDLCLLRWRPLNYLDEFVTKEGPIPESADNEVDDCRHHHCRVIYLHDVFSWGWEELKITTACLIEAFVMVEHYSPGGNYCFSKIAKLLA
jgi:hypothetical protein